MDIVELGNVIEVKEEHFSNALLPMDIIVLGKVIEISVRHLAKAKSQMCVIPFLTLMLFIF